jgi:hypothetical protein
MLGGGGIGTVTAYAAYLLPSPGKRSRPPPLARGVPQAVDLGTEEAYDAATK